MQSLPNDARPIDNRVSVLTARNRSDEIACLIVHAVCHPVALPQTEMGADFPGAIRLELQARYGNHVPVLFLQGHCGDIRPRLIHQPRGARDAVLELLIGPRFRKSQPGDAQSIGASLASAAVRAIEAGHLLDPDFASAPGQVQLRDDLEHSTGRLIDVTAWRVSRDLILVASSGEMLSGLASTDSRILSVGYANGMAGYVAPAAEYAGGGYEIDGFLEWFGLDRRFSSSTETLFLAERARLLATLSGLCPTPAGAA